MPCAIAVASAISGCSQSSGYTGGLPASPTATTNPPNVAPTVTDVFPALGSAGGGATIKIRGTGFMPGMVAMFDGIKVTAQVHSQASSITTFYTETPAHAVGTVDVVVTNPDGQSQRLAAGYTYAPQDSFDLNGVWSGYSLYGTDTLVDVVIQDNRLVSASCAYNVQTPFTFSESPRVQNGEFLLIADGGATLSGRIVSVGVTHGKFHPPHRCQTGGGGDGFS